MFLKPLKSSQIFFMGFMIGMFVLQSFHHMIREYFNFTDDPSRSNSLVFIDPNNYLANQYLDEMKLAASLEQYDQVILALEEYYRVNQTYPKQLDELIPNYLPYMPLIYIPSGEILHYSFDNYTQEPFVFYIYGHYPGPASMHGWLIKYCPIEQGLCGETHERHTMPLRINPRWIWVSSSAL